MSNDLVVDFGRRCRVAGIAPVEAIKKGGLHRSTWYRWASNQASPTLRTLAAANRGLELLLQDRLA